MKVSKKDNVDAALKNIALDVRQNIIEGKEYREIRGIREYVIPLQPEQKHPTIDQFVSPLRGGDEAKRLGGAAKRLLERFGFREFIDSVKTFSTLQLSGKDTHASKAAVDQAFRSIAFKWGMLSQLTLAAEFYASQHSTIAGVIEAAIPLKQRGSPPGLLNEVEATSVDSARRMARQNIAELFHHCEIWHLWKTEFDGGHAKLYAEKTANESRSRGAATTKNKAAQVAAIINEEIIRLNKRTQDKAKLKPAFVARNIKSAVDDSLKRAGLPVGRSDEAFVRRVRGPDGQGSA